MKVRERDDTEWAAPTVLAVKEDGLLTFCVDYRKLNGVTERYPYPYP